MAETINTFRSRKTAWDVQLGNFGFGTMGSVDPTGMKFVLEPIWRATTGGKKVVMGHFIVGMEGVLKAQVMDVTLAAYQAATPWWSSGSIPLSPLTQNTDLYSYAEPLVFHPHDMGDATEDITFPKAVILTPAGAPKRDAEGNDVWDIEFMPYPDRASILTGSLKYGYIGATSPW
jgi:hypothetical protein